MQKVQLNWHIKDYVILFLFLRYLIIMVLYPLPTYRKELKHFVMLSVHHMSMMLWCITVQCKISIYNH